MTVTVADLQIKFSSETGGATRDISALNQKVGGLGKSIGTAFAVTGGNLLAAGITAAAGAFGGLTTGAFTFERQMANVNSIAQLSDDQLRKMSQSVNALATGTVQAPEVLAAGLYDIYSSGFQGAEALNILEVAAKGATAGMTDTAISSRVLVGVMNAGMTDLGGNALGADKAMDILFKTVDKGVLTFPALANNMGKTTALAAPLGVSLEELGAAYAVMTRHNISAAESETDIAGLMRATINPTEKLTTAVKAYGFDSAEALIKAKGFPGFLEFLHEAAGDSLTSLTDLLGTQEAGTAALNLGTDAGKEYNAMLKEMGMASGSTDRALQKQMKSASLRMDQAKIAVKQAATAFVGALAPGIAQAAQGFTFLTLNGLVPMVDAFSDVVAGGSRFTGFLKDAFTSGKGVEGLLGDLFGDNSDFVVGIGPGGPLDQGGGRLREFARSLLTIADSVGDVVSAFQAGGLSGAAAVVGEELSNVGDELLNIARLGLEVVAIPFQVAFETAVTIGGWLWEHRGAIWEGIKDLIGWGADRVVETITATINGLVELGGDFLDLAGDLWGWVLKELGFGGVTNAPGNSGSMSLQRDVPIGTVLLTGALVLGGELAAVAGDVWGWVKRELGFTGSVAFGGTGMGGPQVREGIDLGAVTVTVTDWIVDQATTLAAAVSDQVLEWWNALKASPPVLGDYTVLVGGWLIEQAESLAAAVAEHVLDWWNDARAIGVTVGDYLVRIGGWLIEQAESLAGAVADSVLLTWNAARATGITLGGYAVRVGGWLVTEAVSLAGAVADLALRAWNGAREAGITVGDYAVKVGGWLVSEAVSLAGSVADFALGAWNDARGIGVTVGDYALKIGGWVITEAVSLAGAVVNKVMEWWNGFASAGVSLGDLAITIATVSIQSVGGWAANATTTVQAWLDTNQLSGFTQAIRIDTFTPVADAAATGNYELAVTALLTTDPIKVTPKMELGIHDAVESAVRAINMPQLELSLSGIAKAIGVAFLVSMAASNPAAVVAAWATKTLVPDIARVLRGAFTGAFEGIFTDAENPLAGLKDALNPFSEGGGGGAGPFQGILDTLEGAVDGLTSGITEIVTGLPGNIKQAIGTISIEFDPPKLPSWLREWGWISDPIQAAKTVIPQFFQAIADLVIPVGTLTVEPPKLPGWLREWGWITGPVALARTIIPQFFLALASLVIPRPVLTADPPDLPGWLREWGWITGPIQLAETIIPQFFNAIAGVVAAAVPAIKIDIPHPDLPAWMSTDLGWLTGPIDTLIGTITGQIGRITGAFGDLADAAKGPGGGALPSDVFGGETGAGRQPRLIADLSVDISAPAPGGMLLPPMEPVVVPITADTSEFAKGYHDAFGWGTVLAAQTFTAHLDADSSPFALAWQNAENWGATLAGQTFTAHLTAEAGGFAIAYTTAFGWGQTLAGQTFTAHLTAEAGGFAVAYTQAFGWGQTLAGQSFTATLDGDPGPFSVAYTEAFGWGQTFAAQTFTAILAGNNGPASVAYTEAFGWGETWAAQTFTATFAGDAGPAASAFSQAMGYGNAWGGQVFTARFAVDTSALGAAVAAAQGAAAQIAALLPHSLAKEGPLSEPVSFHYVADALRAAMGRMGDAAADGMAAAAWQLRRPLAVNLGPSYGADAAAGWRYRDEGRGGGGTVTIGGPELHFHAPIYGVDDLEDAITKTYVEKVVPAQRQALDRRDRRLGGRG